MTLYDYLKEKFIVVNIAEINGIIHYLNSQAYDTDLSYKIELPDNTTKNYEYSDTLLAYLESLLNDSYYKLLHNKYERVFRIDIQHSILRIVHYHMCNNFNELYNLKEAYENISSSTHYFETIWQNEKDFFKQQQRNNAKKINKINNNENENTNNTNTKKEGTNSMTKLFPSLKCGKVEGDVKLCHLGVAVKNSEGVYVAYDKTSCSIVDVDIASVDGDSFLYQIPVQTKDIAVNDCILHNGVPCVVIAKNPIKAINLINGTEDTVKITTNMFGFNFVTKVVSMMDLAGFTGGTDNSMTSMLPLLMLSEGNGDSNNDTMKTMLMMQMMQQGSGQQGQQTNNNMFGNPMMLALLAGDGKMDTGMLLAMSMMQQQPVANATTPNQQAHNKEAENE